MKVNYADYQAAIKLLHPWAAPMLSDLPFVESDDDDQIYIPARNMSSNAQVIGIVLAFMTELIPIVFKNQKWKVSLLKLPRIAILAIKMILSIIKALKR